MNILAIDQARRGAWSVYDTKTKKLVDSGAFYFDNDTYSYPQTVSLLEDLFESLVHTYNVKFAAIEDIQLRRNAQAFKKLAHLQGVLVNFCEKHKLAYGIIAPTQWQSLCKQTVKESLGVDDKEFKNLKLSTKDISRMFIKYVFNIETDDDNLSDAICIGNYCIEKKIYDAKPEESKNQKRKKGDRKNGKNK